MITLKKDTDKFPGFYRGKVLDNNDPDKLGRIKVGILGIFDGLESDVIPWATPAMPLTVGAGDGFGCFNVPEIDSWVWCFFEASDLYQPVFFAEATDGVHGLPAERTSDYPNRRITKTKNGIIIYINDLTKEIKVLHPTGSYIQIDAGGNIVIKGTVINLNP